MYAILNLNFSTVFHLSLSNLAPYPWVWGSFGYWCGFSLFSWNFTIYCI